MDGDPRSEVFTTVAWDGGSRLLAADLHIARLFRHSERLGFNIPNNLAESSFSFFPLALVPFIGLVETISDLRRINRSGDAEATAQP